MIPVIILAFSSSVVELVRNKRLLELGAGIGLLSIVAQRLSGSVCYATDLDNDALARCKSNAELSTYHATHPGPKLTACSDDVDLSTRQLDWISIETDEEALQWYTDTASPDCILAADLVYNPYDRPSTTICSV